MVDEQTHDLGIKKSEIAAEQMALRRFGVRGLCLSAKKWTKECYPYHTYVRAERPFMYQRPLSILAFLGGLRSLKMNPGLLFGDQRCLAQGRYGRAAFFSRNGRVDRESDEHKFVGAGAETLLEPVCSNQSRDKRDVTHRPLQCAAVEVGSCRSCGAHCCIAVVRTRSVSQHPSSPRLFERSTLQSSVLSANFPSVALKGITQKNCGKCQILPETKRKNKVSLLPFFSHPKSDTPSVWTTVRV